MTSYDGANLLLAIWVIFLLVMFVGTVFWLWMLIDCATKESSEGNDKLVWIVIMLVSHWIGAGIYYFVRRRPRIARFGR